MDEGITLTLILAAGGGLAGAVGVLFRMVMKQNTEQVAQAKEIGELRGSQEGREALAQEVMQVVHGVALQAEEHKACAAAKSEGVS